MSIAALRLKLASLPEPMRIGIGLGLGFGVTLLLVVLVMIAGFGYMASVHQDLKRITLVSNVKIELAHKMEYAQRDRAVHMSALAYLSDPFERDEELQQFQQSASEFVSAWQQFQQMQLNEEEKQLVGRLNLLLARRNTLVNQAIARSEKSSGLAFANYMRKVVLPGQQVIAGELDKLMELQQKQLQAAVEGSENSYARARGILLLLCSLTIVIGIFVAIFVLRQVMRQSRELEYKALFDDLTGLPNRSMFFDRLQQAERQFEVEHKPFSIAVLDLDRFKEVNDQHGHHTGDLLLKHVAERMTGLMRRTDTVARMGGDEFMLLLPAVSADNAQRIVKKLYETLNQQVVLEGVIVDVACSMGIATYPDHETDVRQLLLKADIAMYAAKRANVGFRIFSPEIELLEARNTELQNELRQGIGNGELFVQYQPKISHHTGSITGVEVLVRWQHPRRGLIPPDEFVPMAEATGLIQPLAFWVLHEAMQQCVKWREAGHTFKVAFNLSTRNLLDGDLPGRIEEMLQASQVQPDWLVFEITESAVMAEPLRALETLTRLHRMGIQLSLDDFGTGYSSLSYLKKLPVSEIKIDKSFVKDMELDANDTVIVRSTIALGHNLGMQVVAEGVESRESWDLLTAMGCDASQGYYMARPMRAADLEKWLASSPWAEAKVDIPGVYSGAERRKSVRLPKIK